MKLNLTFSSLMLAAGVFGMQAAQLSPEDALRRALGTDSPGMRRVASADITLAATEMADKAGLPAIYAFNLPGSGFAIVTADDNLPALLGYTDNGTWEEAMQADNFKAWIGSYLTQIDAYYAAPEKFNVCNNNALPVEREIIEPLVPTRWNQNKPYFDQCPDVNGEKTMTGCVATAMAQIIKTHEWPRTTGYGSHSYLWGHTPLSFDYAGTTFDWDNMLNAYGPNQYTQEQGEAVATLMKACGVGVNMNYGVVESGAIATGITYALREFFGYDKGVTYVQRDYYSAREWSDLIYSEVAAGRPVIYDGQSYQGGGHCFVCDGYAGDDYFHINWGWSGMYDGNYLLSVLEPGTGGIGAGFGVFNLNQDAIIGIQPPVEGSWFHLPITAYGDCTFANLMPTPDDDGITFSFGSDYMILNYSSYLFQTECAGMIMRNGLVEAIIPSENTLTFEPVSPDGNLNGAGGFFLTLYTDQTPKGDNLLLLPAMRSTEGGEWARVRFQNSMRQYVYLHNDGEFIELETPASATRLTSVLVSDLKADEDPEADQPFKYSGSIKSYDEKGYAFTLYLTATDSEGNAVNIGSNDFQLRQGASQKFSGTTITGLPKGEYSLDMRDELGLVVSYLGKVSIGTNGIGEISDADTYATSGCQVYTLQGIKAAEGNSEAEALSGMPKGIYIVKSGNKAKTVRI